MNKLLVIVGPNASGKSDLAIQIAKLFSGEIISADSRQIYRGMDLGTGKVPRDINHPSELYYSSGIHHHLLDTVSPKEYFSAAQYQKLAQKIIKDIQAKDKLPILCGGTGLYISSIIEGWQFPSVPPNPQLRETLASLTTSILYQRLQNISPKRAKTIDKNNRVRLIRALEIASSLSTIPSLIKKPPAYNILIIGIKRSREELCQRIQKRLDERFEKGMIEEIERLKKEGISSKRLEDFGLEYRWINRFLEHKISQQEMKTNLFKDICHYAKRQMTWFKKIKNVHWLTTKEEALSLVTQWVKK